jgi:hypothetical protein
MARSSGVNCLRVTRHRSPRRCQSGPGQDGVVFISDFRRRTAVTSQAYSTITLLQLKDAPHLPTSTSTVKITNAMTTTTPP